MDAFYTAGGGYILGKSQTRQQFISMIYMYDQNNRCGQTLCPS